MRDVSFASCLTFIGSAPALITIAAMMSVLHDDPILHNTEREARKIGRIATFVDAAGGSVTAVGAVTTFGAVAGLSAAGITSGLGAIGAAVGGGMVAGVVVTAAAPAVIAAASGYGIYRLWRKIRSR